MSNFTTELATAISTGADIEEFFRQHLEHAINSLLQYELTSFLDYEKWDPIGYNSGKSGTAAISGSSRPNTDP